MYLVPTNRAPECISIPNQEVSFIMQPTKAYMMDHNTRTESMLGAVAAARFSTFFQRSSQGPNEEATGDALEAVLGVARGLGSDAKVSSVRLRARPPRSCSTTFAQHRHPPLPLRGMTRNHHSGRLASVEILPSSGRQRAAQSWPRQWPLRVGVAAHGSGGRNLKSCEVLSILEAQVPVDVPELSRSKGCASAKEWQDSPHSLLQLTLAERLFRIIVTCSA